MIRAFIKLTVLKFLYRRANKHNLTCITRLCNIKKIAVGERTYGEINLTDYSDLDYKLKIGSYCSIASNVSFLLGGEHRIDTISTYPFQVQVFGKNKEAGSKGDIVIKDDVWIGEGAIILSGITIGQGAVIAAGSVVTKNVEPYTIVAGNPAKVIKYRFEEDIIQELIKIDIGTLFKKFNQNDIQLIYSQLDKNVLKTILEKYNG